MLKGMVRREEEKKHFPRLDLFEVDKNGKLAEEYYGKKKNLSLPTIVDLI